MGRVQPERWAVVAVAAWPHVHGWTHVFRDSNPLNRLADRHDMAEFGGDVCVCVCELLAHAASRTFVIYVIPHGVV